jgi:hypothetical protein
MKEINTMQILKTLSLKHKLVLGITLAAVVVLVGVIINKQSNIGAETLITTVSNTVNGQYCASSDTIETCDTATGKYSLAATSNTVNTSITSTTASPVPTPTPPGDTTAPTITITAPKDGNTVKGTVSVYSSASDNVGVKKVELYVDGVLTSSSTVTPFTTKWSTNRSSKGTHTLQTKAYDAAGNRGDSQVISVRK